MPEASGSILIKSSDKSLMKQLKASKDNVSGVVIHSLLAEASANSSCFSVEEDYSLEGMHSKKGYVCLDVFGAEWMEILKHLVQYGENLELYGSVSHEWGFDEYYALTTDGKSFFGTIDHESGENVDEEGLVNKWLTNVPANTQKIFPEYFSTEKIDPKLDTPSNYEQLVGVWDAKKIRNNGQKAYIAIRPGNIMVYYFQEAGEDGFQYYESSLQPLGGDRYYSATIGALTRSDEKLYASLESLCLFIDKNKLIYCEMDEDFEDGQYSYTCPPTTVSEDEIIHVSKYKYRRP